MKCSPIFCLCILRSGNNYYCYFVCLNKLFRSFSSKYFNCLSPICILSNLNSRGIIFDSIGSTVANLQYPTVVSSNVKNYNCLDLLYLVKLSTQKKTSQADEEYRNLFLLLD